MYIAIKPAKKSPIQIVVKSIKIHTHRITDVLGLHRNAPVYGISNSLHIFTPTISSLKGKKMRNITTHKGFTHKILI
ncbi:hypothetical protein [uncultured Helicobacter sp.]|uniref:hypothetical protein n=1 Tax=uncultured Helicobacter sp. TaxID=175537 RepID=UPI00374F23C2